MKLIKLTALSLFTFTTLAFLNSCEKDAEKVTFNSYVKTGIPMTGAQETPAVPSTSMGTIDVTYNRGDRYLTYTVNWAGLSGNPTGFHVHGLAPVSYAAGIIQPIPTSGMLTSGTYTGRLLVDEVVVKEQDLLNGLFYINIHTATYPNGEIRGQIKFQ